MTPPVLMMDSTLGSADLRHALPVMVPDPLLYLELDGKKTAVVNALDIELVRMLDSVEVLWIEEVLDEDASLISASQRYGRAAIALCRSRGIESVVVPARFPQGVAHVLEKGGIAVAVDENYFAARRRVKTESEVAGIRRAVRAIEAGWDAVREALREEEEITSEQLQTRVLTAVAAYDVVPYDIVIVPHGEQSAIGHAGGWGRVQPGEPLIADLIVRDRATGMYADITRTFCVAEPPAELVHYFDLSRGALEAVIEAVRPGVTCGDLNAIASERFEQTGHPTLRQRQRRVEMDRGFYHGLGHGVGLELHEAPLLAPGSNVAILEGEVLCIEPALYRQGFGGCRLEDMVLVTSDGCEVLNSYPYSLEP